eukprot:TRINITY_DN13351_c0_g1_i2.p1 TRINITY_DN13351_c0_g1~~TRINITY_DN13351_c0_g1_i2.p1  ORF type:complete len:461 (-),score=19.92 TRINITY_DN13351_c0_g1_i2:61-1443(-)
MLGVSSHELFSISDLYDGKGTYEVVTNIYALGRAAQALPDFSGPSLGVGMGITLEEQEHRQLVKDQARAQEEEQSRIVREAQRHRRELAEELLYSDAQRRKEHEDEKVKRRRAQRERNPDVMLRPRQRQKYLELVDRIGLGSNTLSSDEEEDSPRSTRRKRLSVGPVKYGMDREFHNKMLEKFDSQEEYEQAALDWIEYMTKEEVDDIYSSLRPGIILCKLLNSIRPGIIPRYETLPLPLMERQNIQFYLKGCAQLGVPSHELFTLSDLYDKKQLSSVLLNLYAVWRIAEAIPGYQGPTVQKARRVVPSPPGLEPRLAISTQLEINTEAVSHMSPVVPASGPAEMEDIKPSSFLHETFLQNQAMEPVPVTSSTPTQSKDETNRQVSHPVKGHKGLRSRTSSPSRTAHSHDLMFDNDAVQRNPATVLHARDVPACVEEQALLQDGETVSKVRRSCCPCVIL